MENSKILFHGFSPSQFARDYVQTLMDKIRDEAPSGANVRMQIKRVGERTFRGMVTIHSHAGSFFATASHPALIELGHELLERTRRELDKWKSKRFRTRGANAFDFEFHEQ
jgi:hypothetical protein